MAELLHFFLDILASCLSQQLSTLSHLPSPIAYRLLPIAAPARPLNTHFVLLTWQRVAHYEQTTKYDH